MLMLMHYKNTCCVIIIDNQNKILKETAHPHQMRNMPHAPAMIPMLIPDPALLKRKVLLAKNAGDDHGRYLASE